jgi:TolB-like protein
MHRFGVLMAELRRRRVFNTLLAWGVFSFAVLQIYEPVMHGLHIPDWSLTAVVLALAAGFPVSALLAWVFDITPRGIERTPPTVEAGAGPVAGPGPRRVRLVLVLLGLGIAASAPGLVYFFVWPGGGLRATAASDAATGAAPSVAVLPFSDLSPSRDQEYFAEGITEEIRNALARVDGLRVSGRTSSFWFKGKNTRLEDIGRELKVGSVLEGSVRKDGTRVRVTAQLVSVGDGYRLWSETFDRAGRRQAGHPRGVREVPPRSRVRAARGNGARRAARRRRVRGRAGARPPVRARLGRPGARPGAGR